MAETEARLQAWTLVDAEGARAAARRTADGPLKGVPFGVKDIIDVAGLPTECGSPLRQGRIAENDAWLVDRLRRAGAVPLGKTVTTEFAYFQPGRTRNPHNPTHTPGGSSSGSAAAVAACVVPLALGSQTAGSLTRPASFCGVAGYVAPVGAWSTRGITGLSPSLDAPGLITAHVDGLAQAVEAIDGTSTEETVGPFRVLVWPGTELADIAPSMLDALDHTEQALTAAGASTDDLGRQVRTAELADTHATVMAYEAARSLAAEAEHPDALSAPLRALLADGRRTAESTYGSALETARTARAHVLELLSQVDVILGPAAPGPAPHGLDATGTPVLSRPWQLLGLPVVTIPGHRDPYGMPLGLQLIGHPHRVGRLLGIAQQVEALVLQAVGSVGSVR
ncbi:amidase [Streptomyces sp. NPDC002577]